MENDLEYIKQLEKLIEQLSKEVSGPALAIATSRKEKVKVTSSELFLLASVERDYMLDKILKDNDALKDTLLKSNIQPKGGALLSESIKDPIKKYVLDLLIREKLVESVPNPGYKLTDKGKRILKSSLQLMEEVLNDIKRDAFFGWAYRTLNNPEERLVKLKH